MRRDRVLVSLNSHLQVAELTPQHTALGGRRQARVPEVFISSVALHSAHLLHLIGVQVDPDKIDAVAVKMSNLEHTRWVTATTGTYDVFAWATLENAESLGRFLRDEVGAIDGVRRTETFVALQVVKREFGIPA